MGSIKASELISDARRLLQDNTNVATRWDDHVLLEGLNEGQRVLVDLKHDAYTQAETVDVTGGTSHTLPDNSVALIRITRNMGADGNTPGRAISYVDQKTMDLADPDWPAAEKGKAAIHYMFDERHERQFHIWPPVDGYVELVHTVLPPEVEDAEDPIPVDDIYAPAIKAYMVYFAIAQDMDAAPNRELAQVWFGQFVQLVTGKITSEESLIRG